MFIQIIVNVQNDRKTTKMVNFEHILVIFLVLCNWFVLILFASCQTSPGTGLEYPQHILLRRNTTNLGIFENRGFRGILGDCGCKEPKGNLKIDTGHISTIWMLIMQKKLNFETGSKKIFTKRLKTLRIPSAPKKSPRCLDFMKIPWWIY